MNKLNIAKQLINLLPNNNSGQWIIDGGCHIGQFSSSAIDEFPTSKILAFEPDIESFVRAHNSLGFHRQFEIVNAALGNKEGKEKFFRGPHSVTNSLLPRPDNTLKPYYPEQATLEEGGFVDVVTIDDECQKRGIKQIDLLKLDLQGGELRAIKGAKALLRSNAVKVIITESVFIRKYQDQPLLWEIWRELESNGYSLYSLMEIKIGLYQPEEISMRHGQWNQCDAIFISSLIRGMLDKA